MMTDLASEGGMRPHTGTQSISTGAPNRATDWQHLTEAQLKQKKERKEKKRTFVYGGSGHVVETQGRVHVVDVL